MKIGSIEYAIEKRAINTLGLDSQIDMAIEECAELINALCKFRRERNSAEDVITEIADVRIMSNQMAIIFGEDAVETEVNRKLKRLEERLNKIHQ